MRSVLPLFIGFETRGRLFTASLKVADATERPGRIQKAGRSICDGVVIGLDGDEPHRANLDFGRHGRGGVFVSANARRIEDSQHVKLRLKIDGEVPLGCAAIALRNAHIE